MPGIGRPGDVMQTADSRERIVLGLFDNFRWQIRFVHGGILHNTAWLDQNLSKRFLKQFTVSAETTWFERLFYIGITRLVKLNFLKS